MSWCIGCGECGDGSGGDSDDDGSHGNGEGSDGDGVKMVVMAVVVMVAVIQTVMIVACYWYDGIYNDGSFDTGSNISNDHGTWLFTLRYFMTTCEVYLGRLII